MRVCCVILAAASWLAIAGALMTALYGLLVGGEAGQVFGGATVAAAAAAGGLAHGLLRAQVVSEERRSTWADARPGRPR